MSRLGDNLKELRMLNEISQREFAEKMQTTQQRVSEWETGKCEPSLYSIVRILRLYDITFEELIDGVDFTTR